MRALLDFLWLAIRCSGFIWIVSTALILILFVVGTEAEGYSWAERLVLAVKYAGYVGGIFGTLLALYLALKTWRINRRNKKTLARRNTQRDIQNEKRPISHD